MSAGSMPSILTRTRQGRGLPARAGSAAMLLAPAGGAPLPHHAARGNTDAGAHGAAAARAPEAAHADGDAHRAAPASASAGRGVLDGLGVHEGSRRPSRSARARDDGRPCRSPHGDDRSRWCRRRRWERPPRASRACRAGSRRWGQAPAWTTSSRQPRWSRSPPASTRARSSCLQCRTAFNLGAFVSSARRQVRRGAEASPATRTRRGP